MPSRPWAPAADHAVRSTSPSWSHCSRWGVTSRATNSRTAERNCSWSASYRWRCMARSGLRLEAGGPLHAEQPAAFGGDEGELAAGLVDHLVSEHHRAESAAACRRVVGVGLEDQLGLVVVLLGG